MLDRLREAVRLFRKAIDRHNRLKAQLVDACTVRAVRARELADALANADVPEGEGFEHDGLVVWYQLERADRPSLYSVFLAHHHRRGDSK